jgi:hypothetical protein
MNPYLEQEEVWSDFHDTFIPAMRDALSPQVRPEFIVKIEEHLYIREPPAEQRIRIGNSDVSVARNPHKPAGNGSAVGVLAAPSRIVLPSAVVEKETYIEIRDRVDRELVTVIELLSPSNKKAGPDREQYLAKRRELLRSPAHFVEIDLLRGWSRLLPDEAPACDYYVLVSRAQDRPQAGFWPIRLREPLPIIPIPLREPRPEVSLDLQQLLHLVYDRAYYRDYIYEGKLTPGLDRDDMAWAAKIVAEM